MEHLLPFMHLKPSRTVSHHCILPPPPSSSVQLSLSLSLSLTYSLFIPPLLAMTHSCKHCHPPYIDTPTHQKKPLLTHQIKEDENVIFVIPSLFVCFSCLSVRAETNNNEQCRNCHILPMGARLITASSIREGKERKEEKTNTPTAQTKSK